MSSEKLNIILFGETGVGKSSVINLIAGREVAQTSPDVQSCTMSFKSYSLNAGGRNFYIWDTVGLEEPEIGINGYLGAIEQAYNLIQHLYNEGGVDLLLFCIRGNLITATMQSNYKLFYEVLCQSKVPIAIVITHLEREPHMEEWWERNQDRMHKYGLKSAAHACVTGLPGHRKNRESQDNIARLLQGYSGNGKFTMPPEGWLVEFLRAIGLIASLKKDPKQKDVVKYLTKQCRLDTKVAEQVAGKLLETNQ